MRISDWSSAVCSSDLMNAAPHGCTVPCSWVEQTSSSNHDQLGLECARLLERLQYGHEVAGACAKRVHRLHDVVQRDAGREEEHVAALLRSEERRVGKKCVSTCRSRWASHV